MSDALWQTVLKEMKANERQFCMVNTVIVDIPAGHGRVN